METAVGGNGDVRSTKTGDGGEDVYSSQESNVFSADHLVVLVHGILGRYLLLCGIMCFSVLILILHPNSMLWLERSDY